MSFPGYIGKKVGMTQIFDESGSAVPVTVIQLFPLTVTQVKTLEKDGYSAVQVGCFSAKEKHLTRPEQGHFKKHGIALHRKLKEFKVCPNTIAEYKEGQELPLVDGLEAGMIVDITGKSIGKGFQGGIRRWGHHRGLMSHGSKSHRLPGSIGAGTTPGRVFKGVQMAGNTGNRKVTQQKIRIVRVLEDKQVILVKGNVPGVEEGTLIIRPSVKRDKAAQAAQ